MNFLEPDSDRIVRASVDTFLDGRLRPEVKGDRVFETKNSRYRMRDGTLIAATSSRLVGTELVGWLVEDEATSRTHVEPRWSAGARAILLDRRLGRHIVVTSPTLMMEIDGVLVDGSDTRPSAPERKMSSPAMLAVTPPAASIPVIPKAAPLPRGAGADVPVEPSTREGRAPPSGQPSSRPNAPRAPINPSTPPPPLPLRPDEPR